MSDAMKIELTTETELPSHLVDGTKQYARGNAVGEPVVETGMPKGWLYAAEGSYYLIKNPTVGTGVAHTADPVAVGATDSAFLLFKNASATRKVYLDYLFLRLTAAGTGGTVQQLLVTVDDGSVTRYGSAGTAVTPVATGPQTNSTGLTNVYSGAIVSVANAAERVVFGQVVRSVIPVAGDTYTVRFGAGGPGAIPAGVAQDGTAILARHMDAAPVCVGPGQWCTVQLVRASQSAAASWEFELGYVER